MGALLNHRMVYTIPADFEDRLLGAFSELVVKRQTISPKWEGDPRKHPYAAFLFKYVIVNIMQHFPPKEPKNRIYDPDLFSLQRWYADFVNADDTVNKYIKQGGFASGAYLSSDDTANVMYKLIVNTVLQGYFYGGGGWATPNDNAAAKAVSMAGLQSASATGDVQQYKDENLLTYLPDAFGNKIIPTKNGIPIYQAPVQNSPEVFERLPVPVKKELPPKPKVMPTRDKVVPVAKVSKPIPAKSPAKPLPAIKWSKRR